MAAIDRDGTERVARSAQTNRCTALNAKGRPCGAWAVRGEDVCAWHLMTDVDRAEFVRKGGRARSAKARERGGLRDSGRNRRYAVGPTYKRALEVISELLEATLPGTTEPNYEARAYGLLAFAGIFRLRSDQQALELLAKIRPRIAADPVLRARTRLREAEASLLHAYREGHIEAYELPPELFQRVCTPAA